MSLLIFLWFCGANGSRATGPLHPTLLDVITGVGGFLAATCARTPVCQRQDKSCMCIIKHSRKNTGKFILNFASQHGHEAQAASGFATSALSAPKDGKYCEVAYYLSSNPAVAPCPSSGQQPAEAKLKQTAASGMSNSENSCQKCVNGP